MSLVKLSCHGAAILAAVWAAIFSVAAFAQPGGELPLHAQSRIQVVYFSAADCPFCQRWEAPRGGRALFLATPPAAEVEFFEARRARLATPPSVNDVPAPARWIWERAWIPRATPAWLVAVDDTVVLTVAGLGHWESDVRPLVERLVAQRARLRRSPRSGSARGHPRTQMK